MKQQHQKSTVGNPIDKYVSSLGRHLRSYQSLALHNSKDRFEAGVNTQLVVLPTGMGKSVIFALLREFFGFKKKVLVIVHLRPLVDNAKAQVDDWNPALITGVEKGAQHLQGDENIVVASVPTLANENRLLALNPDDYDAVIVDECHHSEAATYRNIYKHFGFLDAKGKRTTNPKRLLLGLTATPIRGDGIDIRSIFQEIVYSYTVSAAISEGWLVDLVPVAVQTTTNLDKVRERAGKLDDKDLSRAVNNPERNRIVVDAWKKYSKKRTTIVFAVDIQHAKDLAAAFRKRNINAEAIWSKDKDEDDKLKRFRDGKLRVLVNVRKLSEGFDAKNIGCVIMARPTLSKALYLQMCGRGTRVQPGIHNILEARADGVEITKDDCIVLDLIDPGAAHEVVHFNEAYGLPKTLDISGHGFALATRCLEAFPRWNPDVNMEQFTTLAELLPYAAAWEPFAVRFPDLVLQYSQLQWHREEKDTYKLTLPSKEVVHIYRNSEGFVVVDGAVDGKVLYQVGKQKQALMGPAITWASDRVREMAKPVWRNLLLRESMHAWRSEPATDNQTGTIMGLYQKKGLNLRGEFPRMTKGEASMVITKLMTEVPQLTA